MAQLCCQPASFPARPPAQHQGLGDTPDSNCAVRSRRLAQCHEPRSAQDPGPSVWEGPGGHLGLGRDPPRQGQGSRVFIPFVQLHSISKPNERPAPRIALGAAPVPAHPGPAPSCTLQATPHPFSVAPCPSWGDQASLPLPAGSQPATPRPWGPAAQPAVPTPTSSPCILQSHHGGDLEVGVTPLHDSPITQPATSGRVGCLQTSTRPAAAPLPLCASVGLRMPPEVLMALPSPGTAQESSSAPKGPCRSIRRAHSRLWNEDARGGVAYRQQAFLSPNFGG